MKNIFLFAILLLSTNQAQAAWTKTLDCNNGELVIDQNEHNNTDVQSYQMVLRGEPLQYFIKVKAVDPKDVNQAGELVLPMTASDQALLGTIAIQDNQERIYWVDRKGSDADIRVELSAGPGNVKEIANWRFYNCYVNKRIF